MWYHFDGDPDIFILKRWILSEAGKHFQRGFQVCLIIFWLHWVLARHNIYHCLPDGTWHGVRVPDVMILFWIPRPRCWVVTRARTVVQESSTFGYIRYFFMKFIAKFRKKKTHQISCFLLVNNEIMGERPNLKVQLEKISIIYFLEDFTVPF